MPAYTRQFPPSFLLLNQEAELIRATLTSGLTSLKRASAADRGAYYIAFLQLSVGIERLLKLILIVDEMVTHKLEVPSRRYLRDLGHDLERLVEITASHHQSNPSSAIAILAERAPERKILRFLSDFAKTTRYYNLDALSHAANLADPLAMWDVLAKTLPPPNLQAKNTQRTVEPARRLAKAIDPHMLVLAHDLQGRPISVEGALTLHRLHTFNNKYAVVHINRLLRLFRNWLEEACDRAQTIDHAIGIGLPSVPYLAEFVDFTLLQDSAVLKKRRWP